MRLEGIAKARPAGIVLREKDLTREEYKRLAEKALAICQEHGTPCILHSYAGLAAERGCKALHLPLRILRELSEEERERFSVLGASCHSPEDAMEAEALGCTYVTAGHVFDTDCKRGLPGRGLGFLKEVCGSVSIPVYAIGGIGPDNIADVRKTGAAGACVMSSAMVCADVQAYFLALEEK